MPNRDPRHLREGGIYLIPNIMRGEEAGGCKVQTGRLGGGGSPAESVDQALHPAAEGERRNSTQP